MNQAAVSSRLQTACEHCSAPVFVAYAGDTAIVCDRQQTLDGSLELLEVDGRWFVERCATGRGLYQEHRCRANRVTRFEQDRTRDVARALAYASRLPAASKPWSRAHVIILLAQEVRRLMAR